MRPKDAGLFIFQLFWCVSCQLGDSWIDPDDEPIPVSDHDTICSRFKCRDLDIFQLICVNALWLFHVQLIKWM